MEMITYIVLFLRFLQTAAYISLFFFLSHKAERAGEETNKHYRSNLFCGCRYILRHLDFLWTESSRTPDYAF